MNFIDPSDFQNLTSDLLAMINHEKMALTKFGNMSIKSLLAPFVNGLLMSNIYFYGEKVHHY